MLNQPVFNLMAPDRYMELLNFEMEVMNVIQAKVYYLSDAVKVSVIRNWLDREGLQLIQIH